MNTDTFEKQKIRIQVLRETYIKEITMRRRNAQSAYRQYVAEKENRRHQIIKTLSVVAIFLSIVLLAFNFMSWKAKQPARVLINKVQVPISNCVEYVFQGATYNVFECNWVSERFGNCVYIIVTEKEIPTIHCTKLENPQQTSRDG